MKGCAPGDMQGHSQDTLGTRWDAIGRPHHIYVFLFSLLASELLEPWPSLEGSLQQLSCSCWVSPLSASGACLKSEAGFCLELLRYRPIFQDDLAATSLFLSLCWTSW